MATPTIFEGLQVVDLTQGFAGAIATMVLADNGADVTRVEPPENSAYRGDPVASVPGAHQWHRSKRLLTADLIQPEDRRTVADLASRADIVVESFRPGVLERHGLGYKDLHATNEGLIYCSITGFGPPRTPARHPGVRGRRDGARRANGRLRANAWP